MLFVYPDAEMATGSPDIAYSPEAPQEHPFRYSHTTLIPALHSSCHTVPNCFVGVLMSRTHPDTPQ